MNHDTPTLLRPEEARALAARAFAYARADGTEITLSRQSTALTRFANNGIHQNVAEISTQLSVRSLIGGRMARASTNRLDDEAIANVVARAEELARLQEPDSEVLPLPEAQNYPAVARYVETTAQADAAWRARQVEAMVEVAKAEKLIAAGIAANHAQSYAILNSRGLEAFYQESGAEYSVTMTGDSSSGWAKGSAVDMAALDYRGGAERAARKSRASADPGEISPGLYTVVLEPAAVLDLLGFLIWDFSGLAVLDQRSCLTGRVGEKLFGDNISIHDDAGHPLQTGAPFDGEGMPRRQLALVDHGTVKELAFARTSAARMRREHPNSAAQPTGHGFPLPNEYGEAPMNVVMRGGQTSEAGLLEGIERGVLVTRLWYIREVEPFEKLLTGMTRDGTFLIENGRITRGLRNFRFNQSVIEMLRQVEAMGPAVRASGEESFDMVVPALRVNGFNFTEVTRF